ncbi:MAG TPA: hypothetical protein PKA28_16695 [Methylomusa anaerophila]|uniref:Nickel transporter ATP-binding protein NikE n=1 Tax=Methylomusa anaerophila TaxID=1930071 RepID=A0A348AEQ3_9FIRM|nr:hypothetical protein [Methylomusa anaerophila]BBB89551.1 nickel transporter ATP-binding protein NikE [Methylomusa anaerophila]HML90081.1 hypothetical protein [Methylomusa anaerophila]
MYIARAISLRLKLIVLDEAVSSPDVLVQAQILAFLTEIFSMASITKMTIMLTMPIGFVIINIK